MQKNKDTASVKSVTIVGSYPPLLGISAYCSALTLAMADLVDVEFISFKKMYPQRLYPLDQQEDPSSVVPCHANLTVKRELTWYNPISWIKTGIQLQGEVVHLQWWSLPLAPILITILLICRIRRIPVIITVHNVLPHEKQNLHRFHITLSRFLYTYSQKLIVHSVDNKHELEQVFCIPPEKTSVIAHGVLSCYQSQNSGSKTQLRRQFGLPIDSSVVLMFGSVRKYKGIDTAIHAFGLIRKSIPNAVLLIAGALWIDFKPYTDIIERLGLQNHVYTVLEFIPEDKVADYFGSADIVLLPYHSFSSQSGVGLATLPFALPLVVSKIGGLKDLVCDLDSQIQAGDAAGFAARVIQILKSNTLKQRLVADSIYLSKQYSWKNIAERTLRVYTEILTKHKTSSKHSV